MGYVKRSLREGIPWIQLGTEPRVVGRRHFMKGVGPAAINTLDGERSVVADGERPSELFNWRRREALQREEEMISMKWWKKNFYKMLLSFP